MAVGGVCSHVTSVELVGLVCQWRFEMGSSSVGIGVGWSGNILGYEHESGGRERERERERGGGGGGESITCSLSR